MCASRWGRPGGSAGGQPGWRREYGRSGVSGGRKRRTQTQRRHRWERRRRRRSAGRRQRPRKRMPGRRKRRRRRASRRWLVSSRRRRRYAVRALVQAGRMLASLQAAHWAPWQQRRRHLARWRYLARRHCHRRRRRCRRRRRRRRPVASALHRAAAPRPCSAHSAAPLPQVASALAATVAASAVTRGLPPPPPPPRWRSRASTACCRTRSWWVCGYVGVCIGGCHQLGCTASAPFLLPPAPSQPPQPQIPSTPPPPPGGGAHIASFGVNEGIPTTSLALSRTPSVTPRLSRPLWRGGPAAWAPPCSGWTASTKPTRPS